VTIAPLNLLELEELAKQKLPAAVFDYFAGGSQDEISLAENVAAYRRIALRYHTMVDVSARDLSTEILGQSASMPILIAPMAFQRLAHPEGELATARAASAKGTITVLSCLANVAVEDVVKASSTPIWFQLYVYRDRGASAALVQRAESAGCRALVVTVDVPVQGLRERDSRNRFALPESLRAENMTGAGYARIGPAASGSGLSQYVAQLIDPGLTWRDVAWLRSLTRLPIVLKGIVRPDDALKAFDCGVAAVVVSNHGGRQLDTAPSTISVLAEIAEAVNGRGDLLVDGGVRRGTDVVKALALGAKAVLLGRPVLWGLALDGEKGVAVVLDLIRSEFDTALALVGCRRPSEITRDLVRV
jgi:4-hydroxymandelate oxidase